MQFKRITFRFHAVRQMFKRSISEEDVLNVLELGQIIENYPEDEPYPSRLMLGWSRNRPLHVVAAVNGEDNELIVVTTYEPDLEKWDREFKRRVR